MIRTWFVCLAASSLGLGGLCHAEEMNLPLQLREQVESPPQSGRFERRVRDDVWPAKETAVIVCDVWDLHHCMNAVRRLEEFAPRLDDVLKEARRRGATIIHAPSDCMPAYADHPARKRAVATPAATRLPADIASWCSRIPAEERAAYPIDQSDGGEDDDPTEHAAWAAKLKSLGRNPGMPWKKQSDLIEIDADRDFISDRGDEVWNILEQRGLKRVILTGVHTNMCVLGRPFGLRQMARIGRQVVLMRDMTDCMYNPRRWPYVNHFTGNDLIISHVERFVCPTITSDQLLGGQPFRSRTDTRPRADLTAADASLTPPEDRSPERWLTLAVPVSNRSPEPELAAHRGVVWQRCTLRLPKRWADGQEILVKFPARKEQEPVQAWLNGKPLLATSSPSVFRLPPEAIVLDDANLLVVRLATWGGGWREAPTLSSGTKSFALNGRWQFRTGDDSNSSNMPLPAKFGTSTDIVFEPK